MIPFFKPRNSGLSKFPIPLFAVLLVVIVVQIFELLLLQRKYDLFTGGFLQPYSYLTWPDRLQFIGLSLWMDLTLFGAIGLLWFWISERRHIRPLITAYNFTFFSIAVMGLWLALKFKVLSYFNDTLNFFVIKNLGGGNLLDAFNYIADEAIIFVVRSFFLVFTYWFGLRWIKRHLATATTEINGSNPERPRSTWILALTIALPTIALVAFVNSEPSLRYGLKKKTSYTLISKGLDELTDLDRDGYGLFRFPIDLESLNASIYPGALDVPENGIDEDGYGGDFKWEGAMPDSFSQLAPKPGKHILLIVLESARGDLLGKTWRNQPVAPHITQLAQSGTHVDYAYSHTGYTTSSIRALLNRTLSSRNNRIMLTDFLNRSGYSLSFISGQDESFGGVAESTGMTAPGHYYFDARSALEDRVFSSKEPGSLRLSEDRVVRQFDIRVDEVDWKKPQFFYLNLQAAHFPYSHPAMPALINDKPIPRSDISLENRSWLQATYWNAIAVADQAVGSMIERLKQLGVYENTVVVILGDHGESLFDDHFLGHGHALNDTQTRIPLVINRSGLAIDSATGQMDIAELVVRVATDRFNSVEWKTRQRPQLQVIGSLDKPQLIGVVSYGDIRTILDLRTRKVFFSDLERWEDFDKAIKDPDLNRRTKTLLDTWERARWEEHLSRSKPRDGSPAS